MYYSILQRMLPSLYVVGIQICCQIIKKIYQREGIQSSSYILSGSFSLMDTSQLVVCSLYISVLPDLCYELYNIV